MDEFWAQGDEEKARNLTVTKLFDRSVTDLHSCQVGFINHVIKPWFDLWAGLLCDEMQGDLFLKNIQGNLAFMRRELEKTRIDNQPDESKIAPPDKTGNQLNHLRSQSHKQPKLWSKASKQNVPAKQASILSAKSLSIVDLSMSEIAELQMRLKLEELAMRSKSEDL